MTARQADSRDWTGGEAAVVFVLSIPLSVYRGFVLALLWRWFVVPLGAPAIGVVHAMGLSWLVGLATYQLTGDPDRRPAVAVAMTLLFTTLALVAGSILAAVMS